MDDGSIKRKWRYSWRLVLLDIATLTFVAGIISTVSSSVGGSSTFTLSLILAGAVVEAIRRLSTKVISRAMLVVDLVTMILIAGIVSNPKLWGMSFIATTLLAWVIVQGARYFIGKSTYALASVMQVAITFWIVYSIAMSNDISVANAVFDLILWGLAEVAWIVTVQVLFDKRKAQPLFAESNLVVANDSLSQCKRDEDESSSITTKDVANHLYV